jgi:hypothetical protein
MLVALMEGGIIFTRTPRVGDVLLPVTVAVLFVAAPAFAGNDESGAFKLEGAGFAER